MEIVRAERADIPAVERLLADAGLPLDGAAQALSIGVVARDGDRIVGAAALEPYGDNALLRSVVVAPTQRGAGVARELIAQVEDLARRGGAADIYLITETAMTYFPRLGYVEVARSAVPSAIGASVEFTSACSTSAVVMRRHLGA